MKAIKKTKKTTKLTKEILNIITEPNVYTKRICDLIKQVVTNYYDLPINVFEGRSRIRAVIKAKQSSVYLIRKALPNITLQEIGNQTNYNHSTILHCIKTINNLLETDEETKSDIASLQQIFQLGSDAVTLQGDIEKEYYYINITDCISVKLPNKKAIILVNFTKEETLIMIKENVFLKEQLPHPVEHKNTGLFILQKNKKEDDTA